MEISGEPIPFIEIIDSVEENGPTTKFEVNPKSVSFLASLKDRQVFKNFSFHSFNIFKKVAIVCIAGPQRTGKSFLANRLLKRWRFFPNSFINFVIFERMKGFAIGPTTNPCTKGIWIWNEPVRLNDKTDMLIMDTEGLHSTRKYELFFWF